MTLAGIGRLSEGIEHWKRAVEIEPGFVAATENLAMALRRLSRFKEAARVYEQFLAVNPPSARAMNNLAVSLWESRESDRAIAAYRHGIELFPDDANLHWGYALMLLTLGKFEEGWKEFEKRPRSLHSPEGLESAPPEWDGSSLGDRTLLLYAEGGFGDALNFIRYVPMVAQLGGKLLLECQPELARLFDQFPDIKSVIPRGQSLPSFDFQIALQSLPAIFKTDLATIPSNVPYLAPSSEDAQRWNERLKAEKTSGLKVGLTWAGSKAVGEDQRSRTLATFAPLAKIPGLTFYSLQIGLDGKQPVPDGLVLRDYTSDIHDFAELAALIANLDLVISVDTSVAHLAGALARPVWVLIPYFCDFRLLLEREDSPWYPTMRLFRQKTVGGDWKEPVRQMCDELRLLAQHKSNE